jgi:hypothetical protein
MIYGSEDSLKTGIHPQAGELLNYPYLGRAIFSKAAHGEVVAEEDRS